MCRFPRDEPGGAKRMCAAFSKSAVWGAGAHAEVLGSDRRPGRACAALGRFHWDWLAHTRTHFTKGNSEREGGGGFPGHSGMGRRRVSETMPKPTLQNSAPCWGRLCTLCVCLQWHCRNLQMELAQSEYFNPWGNAQHLSLVHRLLRNLRWDSRLHPERGWRRNAVTVSNPLRTEATSGAIADAATVSSSLWTSACLSPDLVCMAPVEGRRNIASELN